MINANTATLNDLKVRLEEGGIASNLYTIKLLVPKSAMGVQTSTRQLQFDSFLDPSLHNLFGAALTSNVESEEGDNYLVSILISSSYLTVFHRDLHIAAIFYPNLMVVLPENTETNVPESVPTTETTPEATKPRTTRRRRKQNNE